VSAACLHAYVRDRLTAAAAYPTERLQRRDFRLARVDLTVWFASDKLADLCERTLLQRRGDGSSPTRAVVYAMDAEADG
jgi:hypothetical protein